MSPGKLVDEKDVGCQDKSGPGKIHEVILVINNWCTNIIPGETEDDLPEFRRIPKESHITDYSKAESTVQPATLRYSSTSQFVIHFVAFHYDMMAWN